MSLGNALNIGASGIAANQAALQVTGNNMANATTPGYTRQSAQLAANPDQKIRPGVFVGSGVRVQQIIRQVDEALNSRLRAATGDRDAAQARYDLLSQIEAIQNDLSDTGLSSRLGSFFNAFSELANQPNEGSLRTLAVQEGRNLAEFIQSMHHDLSRSRDQLDERIRGEAQEAAALMEQIASLNQQIVSAEAGRGGANGMRDQRDQVLAELSRLLDVSTFERDSGAKDVYLNGVPLVLAGRSRGLDVDYVSDGDQLDIRLRVGDDGTFLFPESGEIGSLIAARKTDMVGALDALENFTESLIYQVNRVHSQGQSSNAFSSATGTYAVEDPTAALTHPDASLDFVPTHGSFKLHVTQQSSGTRTSGQIDIDLDGIGGADMSLEDVRDAINANAQVNSFVTASITTDGRLKIDANSPDFKFSFSDDTSGVLASLGINTYFDGSNAFDVSVNETLTADPSRLAVTADHVAGGNGTALKLAALQDQPLDELGGVSLTEMWTQHVEDFAVRTSQQRLGVEAAQTIVESLTSQRESVSGVSVDEEAINLLAFQRAYQGSARFVTVVDQLMETILGMIR